MEQYILSFTGAGRVAAALCREFHRKKFIIRQIISESDNRGRKLAGLYGAEWSDKPEFGDDTDLIIVAVPDHRLRDVLAGIKCSGRTVVAHTAGSYGLDVFPDHMKKTGVLYPLQTFTLGREMDLSTVPFFIEASDSNSSSILKSVAESVGASVRFTDTDHRKMLHLAAVFVCNFTNHLLTAGKDITEREGIPFDVLKPLITETFMKALEIGPENSQTGPAVRNDRSTIEGHLKLLAGFGELQHIYEMMTASIINYYNKS
jgi:predicted short-subunit dehydrogenase-like oxidoreductase (DUF2520 family)